MLWRASGPMSTVMSSRTAPVAARGAVLTLALTLVLSCVMGLVTPYVMLALGAALWLWLWMADTARLAAAYRMPAAFHFLLAFLVLAAAFLATARTPLDAVYGFNFIMLPLYAPIAFVLATQAGPGNGLRVARLALAGAGLACAMALVGVFVFGDPRGGNPVFGAILLANTAVLLGFLALLGLVGSAEPHRWVYVLGPLFGLATVMVTGSRGPVLAVAPLVALSIVFVGGRSRRTVLALVVAAALGLLVLGLVAVFAGSRAATLIRIVGDLLAGHGIADETARIRLALYDAGWRAFLQSPLIGHGWAHLMGAVAPFLPPGQRHFAGYPQLHNDFINFAVAGGLVGIGTYALLLATPLLAALRTPRDSQYRLRLFGCALLSTAYFCDGLTDLMFGFEFHTALYVSITAILLTFCRDVPP